jgi:sugar fermentation stimulation protein A
MTVADFTESFMADFLYSYPPLQSGKLIKRYQRFFADIELDSGAIITAHCPNTGPMTGVCHPGSRVWVSESDNPKRKLRYTWEIIEVNDTEPTWVGVNTALPNRVVYQALQQKILPGLGAYQEIRQEVAYGRDRKSRIDFLLSGIERPIYVEVKNTTWVQGSLALFPDTVTTRGQKHLQELMALCPAAKAVMLYFINRSDCLEFAPGDQADPTYGKLLRAAISAGVEVLPCRFGVSPQGVQYLGLAQLRL